MKLQFGIEQNVRYTRKSAYFLFLCFRKPLYSQIGLYKNVMLVLAPLLGDSIHAAWISKLPRPALVLMYIGIPMSTLVHNAYKSNLKASLVAIEYEKPIDTLQDILDSGVAIGISKDITTYPFIKVDRGL